MHQLRQRRGGQRGAIAILFTVALLSLLAFTGLALDLAQFYNRKAELQALADATALATVRELNGTAAGVANALARSTAIAASFRYGYGRHTVAWSSSAVQFSAGADGAWLDAAAAQANPADLAFARIDTGMLDARHGVVDSAVLGRLLGSQGPASMSARAVAGRLSINAVPLAVCAMSATAAAPRANGSASPELVEYGFRRGVSYDLMQLNPQGTTAENFVIDPLAPPGMSGSPLNVATAVLGPYVCAGRMMMTRLRGGPLRVYRGIPLGNLTAALNSRFENYAGASCSPVNAPPDANIKPYAYTAISWMSTPRSGQSALSSTSGGKLWTVADTAAGAATAADYGPLWSFAKAVPFANYTAGTPEPANGYGTYAASAWATLYGPAAPQSLGYTGTVPYMISSSSFSQAPSSANAPGLRQRRVLNVPLLSCPVAAGAATSATVLAVGKFFMTVPATSGSLHAEFAGVVADQSLGGPPELLP